MSVMAAWDRRRAHETGAGLLDQGDAGALDGDVGAGADGHADVGLGEVPVIVDAVAGHGHHEPLPCRPLIIFLLLGHDLGVDLVDAELPATTRGGGAIVAGQHDDAQTRGVQRLERTGAWSA